MQLSGKTQITQFFPNCMYCFLPSDSIDQGSVRLLNFIPEFLKSYTYLMEINDINMFSQLSNWNKVNLLSEMPNSHKDGSLFISGRNKINFQ